MSESLRDSESKHGKKDSMYTRTRRQQRKPPACSFLTLPQRTYPNIHTQKRTFPSSNNENYIYKKVNPPRSVWPSPHLPSHPLSLRPHPPSIPTFLSPLAIKPKITAPQPLIRILPFRPRRILHVRTTHRLIAPRGQNIMMPGPRILHIQHLTNNPALIYPTEPTRLQLRVRADFAQPAHPRQLKRRVAL